MGTTKEIKLNIDNIVSFALQYLSFIDPFNHLSDGEKEVLSRIMTSDVALMKDDVIKEKLLLDYDIKSNIVSELSITEARLNNIITNLRKKNTIIKTKSGNKLHDAYDLSNIELPFSLIFKWENVKNKG